MITVLTNPTTKMQFIVTLLLLMVSQQTYSELVCRANINCPPGYRAEKRNCVDIDECEEGLCTGPNTECFNTPGSFDCNCTQGYSFDPELDMCSLNTCDEDWEQFGLYCYKYVEERASFPDAEAHCVSQDGHLISIQSHEERFYLEMKLAEIIAGMDRPATASKMLWLGFVRDPAVWTEESYGIWIANQIVPSMVWMDGEPFTPFAPFAPKRIVWAGPRTMNHTCGYTYEGVLYLEDCDEDTWNDFICQKQKAGPSCEADWIEVENECYFQLNDDHDDAYQPLSQADKFCQDRGAHIAKIDTQEKLDGITANGYNGIFALTSTLKTFDHIIARIGEVYSWTDGTAYQHGFMPWENMRTSDDEDYMMNVISGSYSGVRKIKYTTGLDSNELSYFCKKTL